MRETSSVALVQGCHGDSSLPPSWGEPCTGSWPFTCVLLLLPVVVVLTCVCFAPSQDGILPAAGAPPGRTPGPWVGTGSRCRGPHSTCTPTLENESRDVPHRTVCGIGGRERQSTAFSRTQNCVEPGYKNIYHSFLQTFLNTKRLSYTFCRKLVCKPEAQNKTNTSHLQMGIIFLQNQKEFF